MCNCGARQSLVPGKRRSNQVRVVACYLRRGALFGPASEELLAKFADDTRVHVGRHGEPHEIATAQDLKLELAEGISIQVGSNRDARHAIDAEQDIPTFKTGRLRRTALYGAPHRDSAEDCRTRRKIFVIDHTELQMPPSGMRIFKNRANLRASPRSHYWLRAATVWKLLSQTCKGVTRI